ncbi:MAG: malate synthase G [Aestuariivirga sp.]
MSGQFAERAGLRVDSQLEQFINCEVLPGTGVSEDGFWSGLARLVSEFGLENARLLGERDRLQSEIDRWHRANPAPFDCGAYESFLREIGYIVPEGEEFQIGTANTDPEVGQIAGPQLVYPLSNARFALNAANARWGSLYDALYGTDAIPGPVGNGYDATRGAQVISWGRRFLDDAVPLSGASWTDADCIHAGSKLKVSANGGPVALRDPGQYIGYRGVPQAPEAILLRNNGLHIELNFNGASPAARQDRCGISDIVLEAALTAISDCEDSVTAVDGPDKVLVYRNWLGLLRGDLTAEVEKGGKTFTRQLNGDRDYVSADGSAFKLKGQALLLVRNVGHLMTTPAVRDGDGHEIPEGLLDALATTAIALHDVGPKGNRANSKAGSVYIVKPKMHGPAEVAFAVKVMGRVEEILGLATNTIKIGIMDEERRTTLNLKECVRAARDRVFFINTGFLDRTGDEIHTSMEAGPMIRKADMKSAAWIQAYENRNVDVGLACGFPGRAQIGKGMWAMPDKMGAMLEQKIGHPKSGATTAWVPSPTAAILHATHYHRVNVTAVQADLRSRKQAALGDLLSVPIVQRPNWTPADIQAELDNNAQGILGYVVRWIDQGIGCSKVPDINDVGLMEDRATLRISSQHIANWLRHGICSKDQVMETMQRMAAVVDRQNEGDPLYRPMSPKFSDSVAFAAACDLVFEGAKQPNGYTEPLLHKRRLEFKDRYG